MPDGILRSGLKADYDRDYHNLAVIKVYTVSLVYCVRTHRSRTQSDHGLNIFVARGPIASDASLWALLMSCN